jgi:transglutaminase-like putative cysteine protease
MRRRVVIGIIGWVAWPLVAGAQGPPAPVHDVRTFDLVYETEVQNIPTGAARVDVWIPLPQDDPYQEIISQRVDTPHDWTVHTDPEYGNKILHLSLVDADVSTIPVTVSYRVRRREHLQPLLTGAPRHARAGAAVAAAPDQRWLQPDRLVPLDERIRQIAFEVTAEANTQLEKARAIYDYVVDTMVYDKSGTGWGNGDIYWACDAKTGNCTDFHALFIGLNRAVGIAATFEIGFPLPPDRSTGQIEGYHCWAQFYLDGVGWVPVDTSEANKHPDKREYFFGAHDQHRVLFTLGRDITLQPTQQGQPLNYFIYPYVEVDGQPFEQVDHHFRFEDVLSETAGSGSAGALAR